MEADYSADGQTKFYEFIDGKRMEIRQLNMPEEEKLKLCFFAEEIAKTYEERKIRHINNQIRLIREKNKRLQNLGKICFVCN